MVNLLFFLPSLGRGWGWALFRLFANVSQNTAIYIQDVAIHGVRSLRSKEHSGTSQFLRVQPTAGGSLGADK